MRHNRRNFLGWSAASLLGWAITPFRKLWADEPQAPLEEKSKRPDLVGVKDGSPAQMFEIGVAALGGMERFVKRGQKVLIKPNIGWNKAPTEGANTSPDLVGKIVQMAYQAGAAKVFVFDHTCNEMEACYRSSGIGPVVEKSGGVMVAGDDQKRYRRVEIPGAKVLKEAEVHELYLDADVIINVPVLKHHVSASMTCCLKNMMGVVWDRGYWHREGLHQCIADFALLRRAHLNVVDAYSVMTKNGPRGLSTDDLVLKKMQILSPDIVLADAAAAKVLGHSAEEIKYLPLAEMFGYGSLDLKSKNIRKISCGA